MVGVFQPMSELCQLLAVSLYGADGPGAAPGPSDETLHLLYTTAVQQWRFMLEYRHGLLVRFCVAGGALLGAFAWLWKESRTAQGKLTAEQFQRATRWLGFLLMSLALIGLLLEWRTTRLMAATGWAGIRLESRLLKTEPQGEHIPEYFIGRGPLYERLDAQVRAPGYYGAVNAITQFMTHSLILLLVYALSTAAGLYAWAGPRPMGAALVGSGLAVAVPQSLVGSGGRGAYGVAVFLVLMGVLSIVALRPARVLFGSKYSRLVGRGSGEEQ